MKTAYLARMLLVSCPLFCPDKLRAVRVAAADVQMHMPCDQEWEDRNRALRAERDRLSASHRGLKATLERQRAQQAERLRQISINR